MAQMAAQLQCARQVASEREQRLKHAVEELEASLKESKEEAQTSQAKPG